MLPAEATPSPAAPPIPTITSGSFMTVPPNDRLFQTACKDPRDVRHRPGWVRCGAGARIARPACVEVRRHPLTARGEHCTACWSVKVQEPLLGYCAFTFWNITSCCECVWPDKGSSGLTGSVTLVRASPHNTETLPFADFTLRYSPRL